MRIPTLLQKISELAEQPDRRTAIDVDLMLDYARVLYADLLEWRGKLPGPVTQPSAVPPAVNTGAATHVMPPAKEPIPQSIPTPAAQPVTPTPPRPLVKPVTPPVPPATTNPAPTASAIRPVPPVTPAVPPVSMSPVHEPTLAELAAAMDKSIEEEEDDDSKPFSAKPAHPQRPATNTSPNSTTQGTREKPLPTVPEVPSASKIPTPKASGASAPKDIRAFISINEKYQIMSELFGNDKAAYEDALNHVNSAENEAAALKWLQDGLWVTEERSDAAQYFFDLVKRFKTNAQQGFLGFGD